MNLLGPIKTAIKSIPRLIPVVLDKAVEHAPLILSVTGSGLGVGSVVTAIKAGRKVENLELLNDVELKPMEKLRYYALPIGLGLGSLVCFHGALFVQFKRTAQVAAACAAAEGVIATYQDSIVDTLENGTKTDQKAIQKLDERTFGETVEDAERNFEGLPGHGDVIFIDGVTGFAFRSSEQEIRMAEKYVVEGMQEGAVTYLAEFYSQMDIHYNGVLGYMIGFNEHTRQPKIFFSAEYRAGEHPVCVMHYNAQILDENTGHPIRGTEIRDSSRLPDNRIAEGSYL